MASQQIEVEVPEELLHEIDAVVGPENRRAFLVETVEAELRKRRLLRFLESDEPTWKDEDHPELADGAAAWVRSLRRESEKRVPRSRPEISAA